MDRVKQKQEAQKWLEFYKNEAAVPDCPPAVLNAVKRYEKELELLELGVDVEHCHHGLTVNNKYLVGISQKQWRVWGKAKWYWYGTLKEFVDKYVNSKPNNFIKFDDMKKLKDSNERYSENMVTRDYSMFQEPENFTHSKKHLEKLKASILHKDLGVDYPILVNKDYSIVDGRYRFMARYDLQLPVYYKIAEVTTHRDVVRIRSIHKNNILTDVVGVYKDLEAYSKVLKLHDEFNGYFPVRIVLMAIEEARYHKWNLDSSVGVRKTISLDRAKLEGGLLDENWDYKKTRARLSRLKVFHENYAQFGWEKDGGFYFVDIKPKFFNKNEEYALQNAKKFADIRNDIRRRKDSNLYYNYVSILEIIEQIDKDKTIDDHNVKVFKELGYNLKGVKTRSYDWGKHTYVVNSINHI